MIPQTDILQTLEEKSLSGLTLLPQQLATILDIDEELLNSLKKCWGYGYIFTKNESNKWVIEKDVFIEEDWFIDGSHLSL
ncbi:MAG: hypothetical protein ACFBSE_04490 [Prochloraceae cyanobacterium]